MGLKIAITAPTGYNARELLLPLRPHIDADEKITSVLVITPAAEWRAQYFPDFTMKYEFVNVMPDSAAYENLLRARQIDVVVTPTNGLDPQDLPVLQAAKAVGIRTCVFVSSWDNVYKMERAAAHGRQSIIADDFAVWNTMMRDHLLRIYSSLPPAHVTICGSPRFDYFTHHGRIPDRTALFSHLGLNNPTRRLIHCATTELYPFEYIIKQLYEGQQRKQLTDDLVLYASVHPGGDITKHRGYEKYKAHVHYSFGRRAEAPLREFLYLPTTEEIYMLIALFKHSALLINQSSTVAIESMVADVPVINVAFGKPLDWWQWRRSMVYRDFHQHYREIINGGGTDVIRKRRHLLPAVQTCLTDPQHKRNERQATVNKLLTYTDGSASTRVLGVIKNLQSTL